VKEHMAKEVGVEGDSLVAFSKELQKEQGG